MCAELAFDPSAGAAEGGEGHEGAGVDGAMGEAGADEAVADDGFVTFVQVRVAVDRVGVVMLGPAGMVVGEGFFDDGDLPVKNEPQIEVPVAEHGKGLIVGTNYLENLAPIKQRNGGEQVAVKKLGDVDVVDLGIHRPPGFFHNRPSFDLLPDFFCVADDADEERVGLQESHGAQEKVGMPGIVIVVDGDVGGFRGGEAGVGCRFHAGRSGPVDDVRIDPVFFGMGYDGFHLFTVATVVDHDPAKIPEGLPLYAACRPAQKQRAIPRAGDDGNVFHAWSGTGGREKVCRRSQLREDGLAGIGATGAACPGAPQPCRGCVP